MTSLRLANLAIRFLLEVGGLVAIGYWGGSIRGSAPMRVAVAIVLPVLTAIVWGTFISPKARFPAGIAGRGILGLAVFLVAAAALHARGHTRLALGFALFALVSSVLFVLLGEGDARS